MADRKMFRHPSEMKTDEPREPVSARVKVSTKALLERAAKENGLSVGLMIGNVLDDYAAFIASTPKAKDKK